MLLFKIKLGVFLTWGLRTGDLGLGDSLSSVFRPLSFVLCPLSSVLCPLSHLNYVC